MGNPPPPLPPSKSDKTLYTGIYLPTFWEGTHFIIKLFYIWGPLRAQGSCQILRGKGGGAYNRTDPAFLIIITMLHSRVYRSTRCTGIHLQSCMTSLVKIVSAHYPTTPLMKPHTSYITHNHSLTVSSSSFIIC